MSFRADKLHTHVEDGGIYELLDAASLLKHPDTSEWVAAVCYRDADPASPRWSQIYATTEARWTGKFRAYTSPSNNPKGEEP